MTLKIIPVAIGLIINEDKILVGKRTSGHYAGFWEYPGGKIEKNESSYEALTREMHEELGISVTEANEVIHIKEKHPHTTVHLQIWHIHEYSGNITANEQQELQWANIDDLSHIKIIPTNIPITNYLQQLATQS